MNLALTPTCRLQNGALAFIVANRELTATWEHHAVGHVAGRRYSPRTSLRVAQTLHESSSAGGIAKHSRCHIGKLAIHASIGLSASTGHISNVTVIQNIEQLLCNRRVVIVRFERAPAALIIAHA